MEKRNLAVVVLAVVTCAHGLMARGGGIPGSVAFYSARDGNNEIYVMDPDGAEPTRVTEHPASDVDPAISPDGRHIVFTSSRTGNNDVFVIGSSGGPAFNLTSHPANDGWPRWSPDGRYVVFHSNRAGGDFEIYAVESQGGPPMRLTNHTGIDMFPDWSPNGQEIVFRRNTDIYVLHLRSGEERRLTAAPPLNQMAVWSPNGRQLAFMSSRDGYPSVFVMNADGSDQTNLTPKAPGDADSDWISRAPSWSTNGREIYFMSSRPSTQLDTEIFVMNADGTHVRRLTHVVGTDGSPRAR